MRAAVVVAISRNQGERRGGGGVRGMPGPLVGYPSGHGGKKPGNSFIAAAGMARRAPGASLGAGEVEWKAAPMRPTAYRARAMAMLLAMFLVPADGQPAQAGDAGFRTDDVQTAAATTVDAGNSLDPNVAAALEQQKKMIEEQARQLDEQARILSKQQEMLHQQQLQIQALQRQSSPVVTPASVTSPGVGGNDWYTPTQDVVPVPPDTGETAPTPPATEAPTATEEQRPESEKPTDQLLLERGAILLPPGTLQIEPSIEYTHISANQVAISGFTIFDAIVIGNIEVDDLTRDIFTTSVAARYGVTDRIQVEGRVPFLYRTDSEIFGFGTNNQEQFQSDNFGLGDVEASASYQPLIGDGAAIPDTILRAHARFPTGENPFEIDTKDLGNNRHVLEEPPTGSGFYGVGGGSTFVWRVDPVVFFAGIDATINLPRSFDNTGSIDPGDTYQAFGGVNVQLSELVSLNLSFVDQYTTKSTQEGEPLVGSDLNDARLVLGTAVGVGSNASLTFNASAGLTKELPDFQFTIALPISFSLY